MRKMQRIAITGATGSIGIAIINQMISRHIEVLAICNPRSTRNSRIPNSPLVRLIECDLSRLEELKNSDLPRCDVFYHLGWSGTVGDGRNDTDLQIQNIRYSLAAAELAKCLSCHTFIGAGSQAEYGRVEGILHPDTPVNPENGYGIAKLCAGNMTRLKCEQMNLRHIWIRILSVYGPYDGPNTLVMSMISKLSSGIVPQTTGGEQLWDYLYSEDAGNAFYLAGQYGKDGAVYCLGQGKARPLKEYIMTIRDVTAPEMKVDIGAIPYAPKQVMHLCADISALQNDTGFVPEVPFDEGIRNTVLWYNNRLGEGK